MPLNLISCQDRIHPSSKILAKEVDFEGALVEAALAIEVPPLVD